MSSRVAVVKCDKYDVPSVSQAVEEALDLLGGIGSYVTPGKTVLLKPNAFGLWKPEKAATTHPSVVEAVARLVKRAGGIIRIGESSAGSAYGKTQRAFEYTGIAEVARETSAELINFDDSEKQSRYLVEIDREISFARSVIEADVLISLPKLKTHGLTGISGAIKNMYGAIPGPAKSQLHKEFPDKESFNRAIAAICNAVRPGLSIVDAVVAMEGNGPATGNPKNLGIILAADDPVAIDTVVVSRLMGLNTEHIAMLRAGAEMGLGTDKMEEIEILGDGLQSLGAKDRLKLPITYSLYSSRWIAPFLKSILARKTNRSAMPRITVDCTGCGDCAAGCPVQAIQIVEKEGKSNRRAVIKLDMCISCFCCHELCRHGGVEIRLPLLWRMQKN